MKTVAVLGLFVLVACLQLQANAAECGPEPEDVKNTCHRSVCDEETGQMQVTPCPLIGIPKCEGDQVRISRGVDLSKPYPDCCAALYCSDP